MNENSQKIKFFRKVCIMAVASAVTSLFLYIGLFPKVICISNVLLAAIIILLAVHNEDNKYKVWVDFKQKRHWGWCLIVLVSIDVISLFLGEHLRNSILIGIAPETIVSIVSLIIAKKGLLGSCGMINLIPYFLHL